MATALQGWHPGELDLQQRLGFAVAVKDRWRIAESSMPEQHRKFHTSNLPFIPVTTLDDLGRPWASIAAGATGEKGFVDSPDANTLIIRARLWSGEPLLDTIETMLDPVKKNKATPERFLTAGLGIEFSTRRRNKFAGRITSVKRVTDLDYELVVNIKEALGNCPKYINVRQFTPFTDTKPLIKSQNLHLGTTKTLPKEVIDFIAAADTAFIGSVYTSDPSTALKFPSHAGMNSRGGLPGFIRVSPSDGRTVIIPDYSGNRFLMSLGNIVTSGLASITFVDFVTGNVLYLTGTARVLVGPEALELMPRQACIVTVEITGFTFVQDALPMRQSPGTDVQRSPYSPKIKYLASELSAAGTDTGGQKAQLESARWLSEDVAAFKFRMPMGSQTQKMRIRPGQAIILDFMDWIGPPQYKHMADAAPGSINDDRLRTWTVSSAHEDQDVTWFEMTMREMKRGAVTGALFDVLRKHKSPSREEPMTIDQNIIVDVVGVTGDFFLGKGTVKMLWIAGGIGVTPFLSMFSSLTKREDKASGEITLVFAARDPIVFMNLIMELLKEISPNVVVNIHLFTNQEVPDLDKFQHNQNVRTTPRKGRIPADYWLDVDSDTDVLICGPGGFGDGAVEGLRAAGVSMSRIHREGFY